MTPSEISCGSAPVSWPPYSWPSVETQALDRQHGLTPWEASLDQLLVGQPFPGHAIHEAIEPRQRMALDVTVIEPKCEFIDIAAQVLGAGVVIDTVDAAFHDGPYALACRARQSCRPCRVRP